MRPLDLFLTLFGFLVSGTVSTVEIDSCGKPDPKFAKSKTFGKQYIEIPMLANYGQYRENILQDGAKQYFISFIPKQNKILAAEENKFENFAQLYKAKYKKYKLFLLSHSDDADYKLASERLKTVKAELIRKGIDQGKIYSAIDIGTNSQYSTSESYTKHRIDMLLLD